VAELSACKSCKAPVIFVQSGTTKNVMILDAEPNAEKGNIVIIDGLAFVLKGDLWEKMAAGPDTKRFLDHHASCPDVASYRKKPKPDKLYED